MAGQALGDAALLDQIRAANEANRNRIRFVRVLDCEQRTFSPRADFLDLRRAGFCELQQALIDQLRAQGRDAEAAEAERDLPTMLDEFAQDLIVMRLNFDTQRFRTRTVDVAGNRLRDEIIDARDVHGISIQNGFDLARRMNLDQSATIVQDPEWSVRMVTGARARLTGSEPGAIRRAVQSLGIIPDEVFSAEQITARVDPNNSDRVEIGAYKRNVRCTVSVRPSLNFRVTEIRQSKNAVPLQCWELADYVQQGEIWFPRSVQITNYRGGRLELVKQVSIDDLEPLETIDATAFEIPSHYRIEDLRPTAASR